MLAAPDFGVQLDTLVRKDKLDLLEVLGHRGIVVVTDLQAVQAIMAVLAIPDQLVILVQLGLLVVLDIMVAWATQVAKVRRDTAAAQVQLVVAVGKYYIIVVELPQAQIV